MTSPKNSDEKIYSTLFNWDLIEDCNERHIANCAKYICKFICEFNDITKAYHRLVMERDKSERMYKDLLKSIKKSSSCHNCAVLELKFKEQKSKLKTITNLLEQLNSDTSRKNEEKHKRSPFEKVLTVCTQVEDDYDHTLHANIDSAEKHSETKRKLKSNVQINDENVEKLNSQEPKTPQKRVKKARKFEESLEEVEGQLSPILKKGRSSKKPPHDNINRPTPMKNLTNKFKNENISGLIEDDESIFEESVLNDLSNVKVQDDVENKADEINSSADCSVGLLQNNNTKKGLKDKNLKQGRLAFTKSKPKLSLNISQTKKFGGGLRNASDSGHENVVIKQEKEEIKEKTQCDTVLDDDVDEILESPSCLKLNTIKKYNLSKIKINDEVSCENKLEDDEATLYIQPNIAVEEKPELDAALEDIEKKTEDLSMEKPKNELVYKEDPIRKKEDKKKVPGWSCAKCAEFYEVAFKGNKDMIQKKINQCSKHRGKFNPERQNTPPGFWDMNMPPIEETEVMTEDNKS